MTTTEILLNLCAYDDRNPGKTQDRKLNMKGPCYCDNCFYGRTRMAEEILKLQQTITEVSAIVIRDMDIISLMRVPVKDKVIETLKNIQLKLINDK
jgi:hypothetical protein